MDKNFADGLKMSLGFIIGLSLFLGVVYAVGFHPTSEIVPGMFEGDYSFNGSVNFSESEVSGISQVPSGAVLAFNRTNCPKGWTRANGSSGTPQLEGRYIVGLPQGGTLGATVGNSLSDKENRAVGKHSHGVNDPGHNHKSPFKDDILQRGGGSQYVPDNGYGSRYSSSSHTGISIDNSGSVTGTNAPYTQLLYCVKI